MAAQSIDTFTIEFPSSYDAITDDYHPQQLDSSESFHLLPTGLGPITNLATGGITAGTDIEGLLYVPLLPSSDPCNATAQHFIPKNVTTLASIPAEANLPFIAIAPWVSGNCTLSYLNAVTSSDTTQALIVYLSQNVGNTNFTEANPPAFGNAAWDIDGSSNWTTSYPFPVYAINSLNGDLIVQTLAQYSGNITKAPNGNEIASQFGSDTLARLYVTVDTGSSNTLPSLWVFLLIVLGLLLGMIGLTSLSMHIVQRRRRNELRGLVASGNVDLESLGIKRLKVPKEILDKQPLLVYVGDETSSENPPKTTTETPTEKDKRSNAVAADHSPASSIDIAKDAAAAGGSSSIPAPVEEAPADLPPASTLPRAKLDFEQPSCPICLDDFVTEQSIIRQLPCKHVFHPACIDPVLTEYSSLCPVCKGKVLPNGYTPEITNAMVRRVRGLRAVRRIEALQREDPTAGHIMSEIGMVPARRSRRNQNGNRNHQQWQGTRTNRNDPTSVSPQAAIQLLTARERAGSFARHMFGRGSARPAENTSRPAAGQDVELAPVTSNAPLAQLPSEARPANVSREEWARRRAQGLFAQPVAAEEAARQEQEAARRPKWRRGLGTIFPVLA